jgi:NAD(P)-dependent dehydrogenase (short-subunit alcohol dehydrogenase family)
VQFRDTVVIVTGAASGINRAIGLRFAREEATVVIADVNAAGAEETATQVRAAGGRALAVKTDVRRRDEIDAMVRTALERFGRIDVLVNGAGIETLIPFLDLPEDEWNRVLGVNLTGAFLCGQAVAREMVRAGRGGKIINIASINSAIALPNQAHYVASKGGLLMLTKAMALELAAHKINVNAIGPGVVETPLTAKSLSDPARRDLLLRHTPLNRFGQPADIAGVAVFLASEAADFVTGTILYVDGGWLIT